MTKTARWSVIRDLFDRLVDAPAAEQLRRLGVATEAPDIVAEVRAMLSSVNEAGILDGGQPGLGAEDTAPPRSSLTQGDAVGAFTIERLIGRGGMGEVYLAHRDGCDFEQHVALKLIRPEAVGQLSSLGIGQSTCIGIGGDPIIGTTHTDAVRLFNDDPDTHVIVMIGEIGGNAEEQAALYIKAHVRKPVVGFIAGQTAPPGRRMGHAGAIISGKSGTAEDKLTAFRAASQGHYASTVSRTSSSRKCTTT